MPNAHRSKYNYTRSIVGRDFTSELGTHLEGDASVVNEQVEPAVRGLQEGGEAVDASLVSDVKLVELGLQTLSLQLGHRLLTRTLVTSCRGRMVNTLQNIEHFS